MEAHRSDCCIDLPAYSCRGCTFPVSQRDFLSFGWKQGQQTPTELAVTSRFADGSVDSETGRPNFIDSNVYRWVRVAVSKLPRPSARPDATHSTQQVTADHSA